MALSNAIKEWLGRGPRLDGQPPIDRPLKYDQLARKVGRLLEAAGDDSSERRQAETYDVFYRSTSTFSTHAGVGSLGRYVQWKGDPWRVVDPTPEATLVVEDALVIAAMTTA
jgi:hypothetical protein